MFRIRRIYDDSLPIDKEVISKVQEVMPHQIPGLSENYILSLPEKLRNPLKHSFRSILFVAEDSKRDLKGFALLLHMPDLNFCFLDLMSTVKGLTSRGIGGALYRRVREEAIYLKTLGLFFECLPDDPRLCSDPRKLKQNIARLRFYERYGARPIVNTAYETPLKPGNDNPPYLVYDSLGRNPNLKRLLVRKIVRAILERKYGDLCSPHYIRMVVQSFKDEPIRLRERKYEKDEIITQKVLVPEDKRIVLVTNEQHVFHHIRERGYAETPARITTIIKQLERTPFFSKTAPKHFSDKHITAVHDAKFFTYLKKVTANLDHGKSIYPYVFPIRNVTRPPKELVVRAGYYCIDSFTPLNHNAYVAARTAVDCALTAAEKILQGYRLTYALVRPPGHHAERRAFGGFCYLNSAAIAAEYLSASGKVAILDIDYHHGNGQQDIFFERSDVLTISIHGHPHFTYPYFSGFKDEVGVGAGKGYNINIPLPENIDGLYYKKVLGNILVRLTKYRPQFLIVALGLDTAKGDPTGTWTLNAQDFQTNGWMIGRLKTPTLVIQEGGYDNQVLGRNVRNFFKGLWSAFHTPSS